MLRNQLTNRYKVVIFFIGLVSLLILVFFIFIKLTDKAGILEITSYSDTSIIRISPLDPASSTEPDTVFSLSEQKTTKLKQGDYIVRASTSTSESQYKVVTINSRQKTSVSFEKYMRTEPIEVSFEKAKKIVSGKDDRLFIFGSYTPRVISKTGEETRGYLDDRTMIDVCWYKNGDGVFIDEIGAVWKFNSNEVINLLGINVDRSFEHITCSDQYMVLYGTDGLVVIDENFSMIQNLPSPDRPILSVSINNLGDVLIVYDVKTVDDDHGVEVKVRPMNNDQRTSMTIAKHSTNYEQITATFCPDVLIAQWVNEDIVCSFHTKSVLHLTSTGSSKTISRETLSGTVIKIQEKLFFSSSQDIWSYDLGTDTAQLITHSPDTIVHSSLAQDTDAILYSQVPLVENDEAPPGLIYRLSAP